MRITAGQKRGRLVTCPEGGEVRPTASKVRQALFNILAGRMPDCAFLDVCAGSGLMSLEALSRGAGKLVAIEEKRLLVKMFEDNLHNFGYEAQIICGDLRKVWPRLDKESFDIIFADPPYRSQLGLRVLHAVAKAKLLKPDGILVIEHGTEYPLPETSAPDSAALSEVASEQAQSETSNSESPAAIADALSVGAELPELLKLYDVRKYGQTAIAFYKR